MNIDPAREYTATIETEHGDLVLELFAADGAASTAMRTSSEREMLTGQRNISR
jgi:hypothetical protein